MGVDSQKQCVELWDNTESRIAELSDGVRALLKEVSGLCLRDIRGLYTDVFLQPEYLDSRDKVCDDRILEYSGDVIHTGNYVGVLGDGHGNEVRIKARFDISDEQPFLQYLLMKVLGARMVDLHASIGRHAILDLSEFLFPGALTAAVAKGLLRTYRGMECNDSNVKGRVDVARHIRENIPFRGRISYTTRVKTSDNDLIQLVRHTIEEIARSSHSGLLSGSDEMSADVALIRLATPTYDENVRSKIIAANLRPSRHPYYTEYDRLRRVCLKVLLHHRVSFGGDGDRIWGILFDVSWLWEEYVYGLLKQLGKGTIRHPSNVRREGGLRFFENGIRNMYPDFLWNIAEIQTGQRCDVVLDTKYKRLRSNGAKQKSFLIQRSDRYQLLSYMHTTFSSLGLLLYPWGNDGTDSLEDEDVSDAPEGLRVVAGEGGKMGGVAFKVPCCHNSFCDFVREMKRSEGAFLEGVRKYIATIGSR